LIESCFEYRNRNSDDRRSYRHAIAAAAIHPVWVAITHWINGALAILVMIGFRLANI